MYLVVFCYSSSPDYVQAMELLTCVSKQHKFLQYHLYPLSYKKYWKLVSKINKENDWDHRGVILAIRELGFYGGPKQYIGNLDQLIEFIYEHFGLYIVSCRREATKQIGNFLEQIEKENEYYKNLKEFVQYTYVAIVGAGNMPGATRLLSYQLLKMSQLHSNDGIKIKLFDLNPNRRQSLEKLCVDLNMVEEKKEPKPTVIVVDKLEEALQDCKIIILLGNFRRVYNSLYEDLRVNQYVFSIIGKCIDQVAPPDVKIILVCMKYMCYIGNVLIDNIPSKDHRNIVGITSHLAEEPILYISRASGIPAAHINGGIVWGFVGITHLIDMCAGTMNFNQFKFNEFGKTLHTKINQKFYPKKITEEQWVERSMAYLINNLEHMWYYVGMEKDFTRSCNKHVNFVSQVNATMRLLKVWLTPPEGAFFYSAAVISDGTYGFPRNMFMSQPIKLDNERFWAPFLQSKLPKDIIDLDYIVHVASEILRVTEVGESLNGSWLKEKKMFIGNVKENYLNQVRARQKRKEMLDEEGTNETEKPPEEEKEDKALMEYLDKKGQILEEEMERMGPFDNILPSVKHQIIVDMTSILNGIITEVVILVERNLPYVNKQVYVDEVDFNAPSREELERCKQQYIKMKRWIFEGTKPTPVLLNRPNLEVKKEEPPIEIDPTAAVFIKTVDESVKKKVPIIKKMLSRPQEPVDDPFNFREVVDELRKQREAEMVETTSEKSHSTEVDEDENENEYENEEEGGSVSSSMPSIELKPGVIFEEPPRLQPYEPEDEYSRRKMKLLAENIRFNEERVLREMVEEILGKELSPKADSIGSEEESSEEMDIKTSSSLL